VSPAVNLHVIPRGGQKAFVNSVALENNSLRDWAVVVDNLMVLHYVTNLLKLYVLKHRQPCKLFERLEETAVREIHTAEMHMREGGMSFQKVAKILNSAIDIAQSEFSKVRAVEGFPDARRNLTIMVFELDSEYSERWNDRTAHRLDISSSSLVPDANEAKLSSSLRRLNAND